MGNRKSTQAIKPKGGMDRSVRFSEFTADGSSAREIREATERSSSSRSMSSSPGLRESMMRKRKNTDPFKYYQVIEVIGVGSMGSVSKVKKHDSAVGGSARAHNVSTRSSFEDSLRFLEKMPFIGCIFHFCKNDTSGITASSITSIKESAWSVLSEGSNPQGGARSPFKTKRTLMKDMSADTDSETAVSVQNWRGSSYQMFYACKTIHLNRVQNKSFVKEMINEIEILKTLDHPFIVRPIETFEHRKQLFMIMELCSGGDLYSRDPYTEEQAARIVGSILSAVSFLHSHNVVHRDLKYENIMFANKSPRSEIKIIDFGLSKKYMPEEKYMKEGVGTIYTMSPEVIKGQYTSKADIWSIGVLAYMLLSSHMPFYGLKRRIVVDKILKCQYDFLGRRWKDVSEQSMRFVSNLLQHDPEDRPCAEEALKEPWLNLSSSATIRWPSGQGGLSGEEIVMDSVHASIETFSNYNKLKKLALMVVAHKSTSEEIGLLRKAFQKYDSNRRGAISLDEFKACLNCYGYSAEELERMFDGCDIDGTGLIRYTEFLAASIEAHGVINEERLAEAFDRLDSDDSGYISTKNLREILGEGFSKEDINSIIEEADQNSDHKISYEEFLAQWNQEQEDRREKALGDLVNHE